MTYPLQPRKSPLATGLLLLTDSILALAMWASGSIIIAIIIIIIISGSP